MTAIAEKAAALAEDVTCIYGTAEWARNFGYFDCKADLGLDRTLHR
jgi:hypothetical protein